MKKIETKMKNTLFMIGILGSIIFVSFTIQVFSTNRITTISKDNSVHMLDSYILDENNLNSILFDLNQFLSHPFPIIGYELNTLAENPICWDENGILRLDQKEKTSFDVILELEQGIYEFPQVPFHIYISKDDTKILSIRYEIEDPSRGFFMKFNITEITTTIEMAFNSEESQFCYRNFLNIGYQNRLSSPLIQSDIVNPPKALESSQQNDLQQNQAMFKAKQKKFFADFQNSLTIYHTDSYRQKTGNIPDYNHDSASLILASETSSISNLRTYNTVYKYKYGIVHEVYDFYTVSLPNDLPGWWEDGSEIDIGIHRIEPTESEIKSDLICYNRDSYSLFGGTKQDIQAYAIYAHGASPENSAELIELLSQGWEPTAWSMTTSTSAGGWLTPTEISNLWSYTCDHYYPYGVYAVTPNEMIIHTTVCHGYAAEPYYTTPYMAKAFVDVILDGVNRGAKAFIGVIPVIPVAFTDYITYVFWDSLVFRNKNVESSTRDYVDAYNQMVDWHGGYPYWTFGVDVKIYGNLNAYLED